MSDVSTGFYGATIIPPKSSNRLALGKVASSPMAESNDHWHAERLFVGPMPMKVAAPVVAEMDGRGKTKHRWLALRHGHVDQNNSVHDEDPDEDEVPEGHAFRYFLQLGGHEEEWEAQESIRKRTKREMLHQWKESGWSSISRRHNKGQRQSKKWVGQTFQVGTDFLGVPMQTTEDARSSKSRSSKSLRSTDPVTAPEASISKTLSIESYHTARVGRSASLGESSTHSSSSDPNHRDSRLVSGSGVALLPKEESPHARRTMSIPRLLSSTSISSSAMQNGEGRSLKPSSSQADNSRPIAGDLYMSHATQPTPLRSALRRLEDDDAKGKTVQFSPSPQHNDQPAPPSEVLARRSSNNPNTSDGAVVAARTQTQTREPQAESVQYGDVFLSDRMLVRRSHSKSEDLGTYFDAEQAMKVRDLRSYEWKEFSVVWRKGQLELYEDYSIPLKEMILGHKHLAFVIPLQKPDTNLSLYSFTDLTFCLTCTTLHVSRAKDPTRTASSLSTRMHFYRGSGTDIFVFKGKTRSRSIDWMWNIWQWLGNAIPPSFEVYCPAIDTRVKLRVPEFDPDGGEGYKVFTHDFVVKSCRDALGHLPSWDYLIEGPLSRGARLELCWRKEATLDWIRWKTDVDGNTRGWEVMYGLCLGKPHEVTHLEARIADHHSTNVTLDDRKQLREPPAVEGYLYRIKPFSQSRTQVYISTHSGCMFSTNIGRAQPPRPPIPIGDDVQDTSEDNNESLSFQELEVQRGTMQILHADVFIDLRSITVVRQAFQANAPSQDPNSSQNGNTVLQGQTDDHPDSGDGEDEGGDEVLSRHPAKSNLKMKRSFELVMRTGNVIRFEAYSRAVAVEWITHLTQLVEYWKHRHRIDARHEMDMIYAIKGAPPVLLAHPDKEQFPERPPDYEQSSEYLPSFWNWCVLDGCLPLVKNGRLFLRRGFRGQYRLMQLVLVSGHLIQFHIVHGTAHHLRSKTISLMDAYICSGHFAIQALPVEEFLANSDPLPRRFQDGLESDDQEWEKVFLIWYRPHAISNANAKIDPPKDSSEAPLNSKRKVLVLKARSRLERNAWCWALNAEVERISRKSRSRAKD